MEKQKRKRYIKYTFWILTVLIVGIFLLHFAPTIIAYIDYYTEPQNLQNIQNFLKSFGQKGWFVFLIMQIIKVIVAIIPGEPIELIAGAMFGSIGGLVTCMIGNVIGSIIVFYLVKRFGIRFANFFANSEKIKKLSFLHNSKKLELLIFIIFFLPGTPKDILTYFAPLTSINPIKYFLIVAFARIPSILTSTITGANIVEGKFKMAIIVFAIATIISIIGYFIHSAIVKYHEKNEE